jgi:aquaporin Z
MKKLIIEFLGTFFFILTIAMTGNAFAIAAMLMAWIYIGGAISGGHYNPLVSLAVSLRGRLEKKLVAWYMLAQIAGGLAAYALAGFLNHVFELPAPGANITIGQACAVEILLAFVFALVILVVATSDQFKGNHIFGFAIGFTIPALAALGGPISGGLFNPAIALGAAGYALLTDVPVIYAHTVMYVGGALLGGALAALFFNYMYVSAK